jgi:hypothetical protein
MRRREFIGLLINSGAAVRPLAAQAQQADRVRRIGILFGGFSDIDPEPRARQEEEEATPIKRSLGRLDVDRIDGLCLDGWPCWSHAQLQLRVNCRHAGDPDLMTVVAPKAESWQDAFFLVRSVRDYIRASCAARQR